MDSLPEPLTSAEHQALIAIVRREAPDLLPLVHRVLNRRWLADDEAEALDRVRPRLMVCGHIHSAYGAYRLGDTDVVNASLVDDQYRPVNEVRKIEL